MDSMGFYTNQDKQSVNSTLSQKTNTSTWGKKAGLPKKKTHLSFNPNVSGANSWVKEFREGEGWDSS